MGQALLVPVKSFGAAKQRLSALLTPDQRACLAGWMAERVLGACGELEPFVVCDDTGVVQWARALGVGVIETPGVGLNAAIDAALARLVAAGCSGVVIAHGDLPLAAGLDALGSGDVPLLVPDRRGDGTNVMVLSAAVIGDFRASYGSRSFVRHLDQLIAAGHGVDVIESVTLGLDVDTPDDLAHPLLQKVLPAWLQTNPVNPH